VVTFYAMLFAVISTLDKVVQANVRDLLSYLSLFMSAAIAAFALYEGGKRYDARSENFIRSARAIAALRDRTVNEYLSGKLHWDALKEIEREYSTLLQADTDNHAHLDYEVFLSNTSDDRWGRYATKFFYVVEVHWLLAVSFLSPLGIFVIYATSVKAAALALSIVSQVPAIPQKEMDHPVASSLETKASEESTGRQSIR
ncbi:hypothetical protein XF30_21050, partial [Bradyrhizobium sp. SUTN9-2]|uniref:SLATT domain-containing protein n=1 Tax=Bradyrhizobium sp. SUTN9-2 TaxID=1167456 RepID=UPI000D66B735